MKYIILLLLSIIAAQAQEKTAIPEIGIVQGIENDSLLQEQGYRYIVESVAKLVSPKTVTDEQFQDNQKKIRHTKIPMYAFNIFIPGELKIVGPDVDEHAILQYAEKVFQRCKAAGVDRIIWGSGGSRRVPEGFDHGKAKSQFISSAKKIAELGSRYDITLALENLNSTETNFINTITEAIDIVKKVNHKNLRLCVDIYHMLKEGESPSSIKQTKGYVVYCEVAERDGRTPPGVHGDDFRPYFEALKNIGYDGKIMIECRWDDIRTQGTPAYDNLSKQVVDVFGR